MPAKKKPVANRHSSSASKLATMAQAPTVHSAPAMAHSKNTRRGLKRSARASSANTSVPKIKPNCKAEVSAPTAVTGQPKLRCKSGITALIANHKEVPANCASTKMGRTWRGTVGIGELMGRVALNLNHGSSHICRLCLPSRLIANRRAICKPPAGRQSAARAAARLCSCRGPGWRASAP